MKISRDWLSDFLDLSAVSDDELARRLTEIGHAVESTETHDGDTVFEIEFTANRIDAMSHLGVARELSAALHRPLKSPGCELATSGRTDESFAIRIEAPELCSRYTGLLVRGVTVRDSSPRVARRLEAVGLRPINNVVDATNYVMLSLGHPLHAFDADLLNDATVVVRAGTKGEKARSLDGEMRELDSATVVIADARQVVALGGVIGAANSEISATTKNVLIECAHFDPPTIRRTARRLGIKTDASYRFERGADPGDTLLVARCAAAHILAEAGGTASEALDVIARPIEPKQLVLRDASLAAASDDAASPAFAEDILQRLQMKTTRVDGGVQVVVPTFRGDINEEIDLVEEVLRFFGFDNVPTLLPRTRAGETHHRPIGVVEDRTRDILRACGMNEVVTYSFIQEQHNRWLSQEEPISVVNALTENLASMRLSMMPGLLQTLAFNRSYGVRDGAIFEVGRTYHRSGDGVRERHVATLLMAGTRAAHWGEAKREADFFDLKGAVESVAAEYHVPLTFRAEGVPIYNRGQASVAFHGDRRIAIAGILTRDLTAKFDVRGSILAAEIDLGALLECVEAWKMTPVSRFPGVPMVLGVLHGRELSYEQLADTIRSFDVPYLQEVGLWDRFTPEGGGEIKTAVGMWYQALDRSLTQEEVAEIHRGVVEKVATMLPVRVIS